MRLHRMHRVLDDLDDVPVPPGSTPMASSGVHCGTSRTRDPAGNRCSSIPASSASATAPATETVSSPDKILVIVSRVICSRDNTSSCSA